jgi:Tfp pilus assembly protein PilV
MGAQHWRIVLIEVLLIFGGVLAFGWWQLRDIRKTQQMTGRERAAAEARKTTEGSDGTD